MSQCCLSPYRLNRLGTVRVKEARKVIIRLELFLVLLPCIVARGQIRGAAADAIVVYDANMNEGQYKLTTTRSKPFDCSKDVGKAIAVYGAGEQYPLWKNIIGELIPLSLVTTIASCQAKNVITLTDPSAYTVANVAMVFGTDDYAAVQACVTAAGHGGRCTFPAGKSFMISNAGQNVTVPSGATIDGSGTIYFAPQGTITAMTNDTLFGVNEEFGTNISYSFRIAAPISKGQTYFSAYNDADITTSGAAVNRYVEVEEVDTDKGATFIDWMKIESIAPNDALVAGTYLSGITAMGSAGQTCTLTDFNRSPTATATVTLSGTNNIAAGTTLFVTNGGTGARGESTSARAAAGTARCSGTAVVATALGSTVYTTKPFRMTFPGTSPWCAFGGPNQCSGLVWRTVLTPAHHLVFKDINIVVPPVASATRATRAFDIKGARGTLIENTHIWQGGLLQDLEEEYNQGTNLIGNTWTSEAGGIDLAESVDGVYQGNTLDHQPNPWNGWRSPCAATVVGGHVDLELGLGWFHFIQNSIPHPCYVGIAAFFGMHDGEIAGNKVGWVGGDNRFSTEDVGIAAQGVYDVSIHQNMLAGADGPASVGLELGDFTIGQPPIYSDRNLVWANHTGRFPGVAYAMTGTLGTDCHYEPGPEGSSSGTSCKQIRPFMISPTPGSKLPSTSPTFSWSSGPGVDRYGLCLGSTAGSCDLYKQFSATDLSTTPVHLPERATIHARLYFRIDGEWQYRSYTYIASRHHRRITSCRASHCAEESKPM